MDNKQMRTSMVSRLVAKSPTEYLATVNTLEENDLINGAVELSESVYAWRNTIPGLSKSIAARGAAEGTWYIDLCRSPETGWRETWTRTDDSLSNYLFIKNPTKVLSFLPDLLTCIFTYKEVNAECEIHFFNNQSLSNYEKFATSTSTVVSGKNFRDIDYSVVDFDEISQGDASDYDFIQLMSWDIWDVDNSNELLQKCINALAPNGVMHIGGTNNSAKLYRDNYHAHPLNDLHDFLKTQNGYTYHNSENYGYTIFTKI